LTIGHTNLPQLPVLDALPALERSLGSAGAAVLSAPPGSGKTTLSPLALADADWLRGGRIIMLEPRRIAARLAATRMASLLGEKVGARVGYRVRFERHVSRATRIEVMTEGTLVRRLQADPELEGVGLVIFDEVHERNLHTDLALTLTREVRDALRPDLRLLAMSATADVERFSRFLGVDARAPIIVAAGQVHPVVVHYAGPAGPALRPDVARVAHAVERACAEQHGDVLVFLPGAREIEQVRTTLEASATAMDLTVLPLHGALSPSAQDDALRASKTRRRVVLATNIAESSVTLEGIRAVVDAGFERAPRFDPVSGLSRLETRRISQSSAEQRAGRAARLGPGMVYRLWSEFEHRNLVSDARPEILSADLAPLALELLCWGTDTPEGLHWLDAPPPGPFAQALSLLERLGAVDDAGRLTRRGRALAQVPAHPRVASVLAAAVESGSEALLDLGGDLAALISGRNPTRERSADIEHRLSALRAFRENRDRPGLDARVCRVLEAEARDLKRRCRTLRPRDRVLGAPGELSPGGLLSLGFPDRIGARRAGSEPRFLLENGRGVRLDESEALASADFIVALEVSGSGSEGVVTLGAALNEAALKSLHAHRIRRTEHVRWVPRAESVEAMTRMRLGAITLVERPLGHPPPADVAAAMMDGIRQVGVGKLPWDDAARRLRARVACLRRFCPDEGWPDLSDEALSASLNDWLGPWIGAATKLEHLRAAGLTGLLEAALGWEHARRLDEEAPLRIAVPSGRQIALDYEDPGPPVLAVRLQELFGLLETPAIARGRIPVMLHILSPAGRPVQVTRDLAGFWARTYAEVRRELKGRYPKHYWPDDPYSATPTQRVRPRSDP